MLTKQDLIDILDEKGLYEEQDDFIIGELFYNLELIKKSKTHIRKTGILSQGDKDGKIFYQSPALKIYSAALKNVLDISKKLGLSPRDRKEMGAIEDGEEDTFNKKG